MASSIEIDFNANVAKFSSQLDRATRDMNKFAQTTGTAVGVANKALQGLASGLTVGVFSAAIKSSIDLGDSLNDLSKSTGLTVGQLSGLKLASEQSGTHLDDLAVAINKLSVNIGKDGDKFKQLGISAKDPLEAFAQLADVFNAIEDPQKRAAVAATALGKAWAQSAPLLSEGGASIRKMAIDGQDLSGVTLEMAQGSDHFNDSLARLGAQVEGLRNRLTASLLPALNSVLDKIVEANDKIGNIHGFNDLLRFASRGTPLLQNLIPPSNTGGASGAFGFTGVTGDFSPPAKPNDNAINAFIGNSGDTTSKRTSSALSRADSAEATRARGIREVIDALKQDIALSKLSNDEQQRARELASSIKDAKGAEVGIITKLVNQKYDDLAVSKKQQDQWDQLIADANEFYDLQQSINDLANSDLTSESFGKGLSLIQDKLKEGIINEAQAKQQFDKLGNAFNESFIDKAKQGTDDLSVYGEQAARNMQNAFADFLFNPFDKGLSGMVKGFADAVARMVANWAAAKIFDNVVNPAASAASGIFGSLISAVFHEGGVVGGSASMRAVSPSVFAGARRYHTGGLAGDEVPAILQKGEIIIPKNRKFTSQSGDVFVSTNVNVSSAGDNSPQRMDQLAKQINAKVREVIMTEKRAGGLLA